MNTLLFIILVIILLILWLFATAAKVNGGDSKASFIVRSIVYWIAIIFTFLIAFYIGKH